MNIHRGVGDVMETVYGIFIWHNGGWVHYSSHNSLGEANRELDYLRNMLGTKGATIFQQITK